MGRIPHGEAWMKSLGVQQCLYLTEIAALRVELAGTSQMRAGTLGIAVFDGSTRSVDLVFGEVFNLALRERAKRIGHFYRGIELIERVGRFGTA